MRKSKKMKPGKLSGPSHKNGGILLEAEGGEFIIKKSSVKKIGKAKLEKINKEGKLPESKENENGRKKINISPDLRRFPESHFGPGDKVNIKRYKVPKKVKAGESIKTYSSGGYVEGK